MNAKDMTYASMSERRAFLANLLRPYRTEHRLFRAGDFGDGGYLVPDDLEGITACFSPGVSKQASFEMDMAKHGIRSFLADASVDGPPFEIPGAVFVKKHLAAKSGDGVISVEDWVRQYAGDDTSDLLLQMDIEGAEYPVMAPVPPDVTTRFRIIVMELHRLPSIIVKPTAFEQARPFLEVLSANYTCLHIHPNNASGTVEIDGTAFPRVVEATFLRNDRVGEVGFVTDLPHPLDAAHLSHKPRMTLPEEWVGA